MDLNVNEEAVENVSAVVELLKKVDWRTGLTALAAAVLGVILIRLLIRLEKKALARSRFLPATAHTMICTLTRIALYFVLVITVAGILGIPVTSFVAVLSVVGIAVTLAVQGLLSNLVGGFILIGAQPAAVGDFVESGGLSGTVKEIGMMYTRLQAPDGRIIHIPNSTLCTAQVINYTALGRRRVDLTVPAPYDVSPEKVREAILLAISRVEGIAEDPPLIWLESFDDSAITYSLHVWTSSADFIRVKYELNDALWNAFRDRDITIPFPQRDVHLIPPAAPEAGAAVDR